jgi:hypothetical protein
MQGKQKDKNKRHMHGLIFFFIRKLPVKKINQPCTSLHIPFDRKSMQLVTKSGEFPKERAFV